MQINSPQICNIEIFQAHNFLLGLFISFGGGGCLAVKLCLTLMIPWTIAHQAPLSMGFSRQEYWSGLPFLSQGIFPMQDSNPGLPHRRQILYRLSYEGVHGWFPLVAFKVFIVWYLLQDIDQCSQIIPSNGFHTGHPKFTSFNGTL